jgi:hypothetical protein
VYWDYFLAVDAASNGRRGRIGRAEALEMKPEPFCRGAKRHGAEQPSDTQAGGT